MIQIFAFHFDWTLTVDMVTKHGRHYRLIIRSTSKYPKYIEIVDKYEQDT